MLTLRYYFLNKTSSVFTLQCTAEALLPYASSIQGLLLQLQVVCVVVGGHASNVFISGHDLSAGQEVIGGAPSQLQ